MILKGKPVAEKIYDSLKKDLAESKKQKIQPSLAVVLVGEDPSSLLYTKIKEKVAEKLEIEFRLYHLPTISTQNNLQTLLNDLNKNKYIHGIIVQLPLPKGFDTSKVLNQIDPKKDVDGFLGSFVPPTARAILEILDFYKVKLKGKKIVLVGHGKLVGEPLERILLKKGLKPKVCDSETIGLKKETLKADILVSAVGEPGLIKKDYVTPNTIVIDAGTAESKGKISGDVDASVYQKIKTYTPNPGGVGPVTVACLMRNLVLAAKRQ